MIIDYLRYLAYTYLFRESNPISTIHGYYKILKSLPNGSTILDVGCGSGIYFTSEKVVRMIKSKNLKIKAIDIDLQATMFCYKRIIESGLTKYVVVEAKSIMDEYAVYDYVLWMESYPVIDAHLFKTLLEKSKGLVQHKILMYHNLIDHLKEPTIYHFMRFCKPLIKYFTFVDFGRVVRMEDMKKEYKDVQLLLSCRYGELFPILSYIPYIRNLTCNQYLVSVSAHPNRIPTQRIPTQRIPTQRIPTQRIPTQLHTRYYPPS
jgi:SAM-dependent methyltransferase